MFVFNRSAISISWNPSRHVASWGLACAALFLLAAPASAQLRSGRVQREIYQDGRQLQTEPRSPEGRQPEVALASHSVLLEEHSVLDSVEHDQLNLGLDYQPPSHGGGGAACDDLGCQECCPGFSDIAPACSAPCPPGCGPLLALWYRTKVRAEVPLYWRRAAAPPTLVTTSPVGTPSGTAGQLGLSSTSTLFGNSVLNEDATAGFRLILSTPLGRDENYGLMFRYWNAGDQDDTTSFNSNDFPILARPFFNTSVPGAFENDALLIAFTDANAAPTLTGNLQVESTSSVYGLELSLSRLVFQDRFTRIDWLYGYQHVGITEGMEISSSSIDPNSGVGIAVDDQFHTENDFNGFYYGINSTRSFGCWKMETLLRLGMGNLRRKVNIAGSTTTTSGGLSNTTGQGLLARDTNNRPFEDDTFVIVPEIGINFAYRVSTALDFNVGYNYMLVPKVAQASQQINDSLAVNLSDPITGPLVPSLNFDERSFWINSLGLGLQLRY